MSLKERAFPKLRYLLTCGAVQGCSATTLKPILGIISPSLPNQRGRSWGLGEEDPSGWVKGDQPTEPRPRGSIHLLVAGPGPCGSGERHPVDESHPRADCPSGVDPHLPLSSGQLWGPGPSPSKRHPVFVEQASDSTEPETSRAWGPQARHRHPRGPRGPRRLQKTQARGWGGGKAGRAGGRVGAASTAGSRRLLEGRQLGQERPEAPVGGGSAWVWKARPSASLGSHRTVELTSLRTAEGTRVRTSLP